MGNKSMKAVSLTYEEAEQRVTSTELKRLATAFRRCAPSGHMSFGVFARDVLGGGYPTPMAKQIFYAFSGKGTKGKASLQFKELLPGLVLLTRGKTEEIYKFIFGLFANDNMEIQKVEIDRLVADTEGSIPEELCELFERTNEVDFATFRDWLKRNPRFTSLSHSLLEDRCVYTLSTDTKIVSFHQTLDGITHLCEHEIVELERTFNKLKEGSPSGELDLSTFRSLVSPPLPDSLVESLFAAFDVNRDGHIDFKELVCGISASCRGPGVERHKFCFRVYDADHDGFMSLAELISAINASLEFIKHGAVESNSNDLLNLDAYTIAREVLESHEGSQDNRLSQEGYLVWALQSDLPKQFMKVLYEVCHVILGLRPDSREAEGRVINGWIVRDSKEGLNVNQTLYLVAMGWWKKWQDYTSDSQAVNAIELDNIPGDGRRGQSSFSPARHQELATQLVQQQKPGPINNLALVASSIYEVPTLTNEGGKLKSNPKGTEGTDFVVVPALVWKALHSWYGGAPALPRNVIIPAGCTEPELELYPIITRLYKHKTSSPSFALSMTSVSGMGNLANMAFNSNTVNHNQTPAIVKRVFTNIAFFSSRHTLLQVTDFLAQSQRASKDSMRLWLYKNEGDIKLLDEDEKTMEELGIADRQKILVELRNKDLTWPEELLKMVKIKSGDKDEAGENANTSAAAKSVVIVEKGKTGLSNLGNTCFLNSALQCVSNTKPLTKYFREELHRYELNKTNPIGMKGFLALTYADLVKDLWSGTNRSVVPMKMRWMLTRYAPQFNGTQQQDAQEVLAFLLDGLHEDLNRVTDKPYCELSDSAGRPDSMVAMEAWENHLLRNRSVVVDLFHGQLKSQVCCKECSHESVRFDPFTYLTLPLPMESCLHLEVIYIPSDGSKPTKFGMRLTSEDTHEHVKEKIRQLSSIPSDGHLVLAEVLGPQIRTFPDDGSRVKQVVAGTMYAYHVNSPLYKPTLVTGAGDVNQSTPNSYTNSSSGTNGHIPGSNPATASLGNGSVSNGCVYYDNSSGIANFQGAGGPGGIATEGMGAADNTSIASSASRGLRDNRSSEASLQSINSGGHSNGGGQAYGPIGGRMGGGDGIRSGVPAPKGTVVAMHRRMEIQEFYFLSSQKSVPLLFGIPLLLSLTPGMTQRDLYVGVWRMVSRLLSSHASSADGSSSVNHAQDCDDSLKSEYPFSLTVITGNGQYCALCPYYRACRGCPLVCDASSLVLPSEARVGIDWEMTAVHLQYQTSREREFIIDPSVGQSAEEKSTPITLDDCLSAFTKVEELNDGELYYCSKCKQHRLASKTLQIWRLPPILIIHFKRFQPHNGGWVKSQKVVKFPFDGFDPSTFFAPSATPSAAASETASTTGTVTDTEDEDQTGKTHHRINSNGSCSYSANEPPIGLPGLKDSDESSAGHHSNSTSRESDIRSGRRANGNILNGSSTLPSTQETVMNSSSASVDGGVKYNLFALSCHRGMLGGGHYVAYSRHTSKKWYEYNDSMVKEVPQESIDAKSAYILFYERAQFNYDFVLPKDKDVVSGTSDVDQYREELNAEYNRSVDKMCVIQ